MPTTFLESHELVNNSTFRQRVQVAATKVAIAVQGEDNSGLTLPDGSTYNEKRTKLAGRVLSSTNLKEYDNRLLHNICYAIVAGGTLDPDEATNTDNDIEFLVTSVFNDLAGVNEDELPV